MGAALLLNQCELLRGAQSGGLPGNREVTGSFWWDDAGDVVGWREQGDLALRLRQTDIQPGPSEPPPLVAPAALGLPLCPPCAPHSSRSAWVQNSFA